MDCFDEILNFYTENINGAKNSSELWTINYIIKLMHDLSVNHDNLKAKNCLIFLLNLLIVDVPDHLHNRGKKTKELTKKEYKSFFKSLKSEFNF
ncbi:MAG: hypothetical protein ACFE9T_01380 [Promethearchaeota archaeon]